MTAYLNKEISLLSDLSNYYSGMSKPLTLDLVVAKCKTDRLQMIKNLNLWGNNLGDVSLIADMPNLEVVSLAVNQVTNLSPFQGLRNLRELYLRKNNIVNFEELYNLEGLSGLKTLSLVENPIANHPQYRHMVATLLPQLTKLDDRPIGDLVEADSTGARPSQPIKRNSRIEDAQGYDTQPKRSRVEYEAEHASFNPRASRNKQLGLPIYGRAQEQEFEAINYNTEQRRTGHNVRYQTRPENHQLHRGQQGYDDRYANARPVSDYRLEEQNNNYESVRDHRQSRTFTEPKLERYERYYTSPTNQIQESFDAPPKQHSRQNDHLSQYKATVLQHQHSWQEQSKVEHSRPSLSPPPTDRRSENRSRSRDSQSPFRKSRNDNQDYQVENVPIEPSKNRDKNVILHSVKTLMTILSSFELDILRAECEKRLK